MSGQVSRGSAGEYQEDERAWSLTHLVVATVVSLASEAGAAEFTLPFTSTS